MATESDTDRNVFFGTGEFGIVVTVGANTFNALFNNEFNEELEVGSEAAVLVTKSSEIAAYSIALGTSLTVVAETYLVRELRPDGTGLTSLVIEKQ